jgi:hypothetical protein
MKKTVLWYIVVCAGGIFFVTSTVLAVMYGKDICKGIQGQIVKVKSLKEKALPPFLTKSDLTES